MASPPKAYLDDESRRVLRDVFKSFDNRDIGKLELDELADALRLLGIHPTTQDLKDIQRLLDKEGKGFNINKLVDNYDILVQHSVHGAELLDAFKKFDTNKDGYINLPELKAVLTSSGEKWSQDEAAQLLQDLMAYDENGDGKFSYREFVQMFMGNSFPFVKPIIPKKKITETFKLTPVKPASEEEPGAAAKITDTDEKPDN